MVMESAIQGLGQLQRSFESIADRKQKTAMQESEQAFQKSERLGREDFTASQSALERSLTESEGAKSRALPWAKFREAEAQIKRDLEFSAKTGGILKQDPASQTVAGQVAIAGAETGSLSGVQAFSQMPSGAARIVALDELAAKHPNERQLLKDITTARKAYFAIEEEKLLLEAWNKKYTDSIGEKKTSFPYDPSAIIPGFKQILKEEADYDLSEEPLFSHLSKLDAANKSLVVNRILERSAKLIASQDERMIASTTIDPKTGSMNIVPDISAYHAAMTMYERASTGGGMGIFTANAYNAKGEWIGMGEGKAAPINIETSTSNAFKQGWFKERKYPSNTDKIVQVDIRDANLDRLGIVVPIQAGATVTPPEEMKAKGSIKQR